MVKELIVEQLKKSADIKLKMVEGESENILRVCNVLVKCFQSGGKLLLAGNGGSAADAQHIAGEFVAQFKIKNRRALPAIALNTNSSIVTSIVNDARNDSEFSRQVEAFANHPMDILMVITTSGNSKNLVEAVKVAKQKNIFTIGLLGSGGGVLKDMTNLSVVVPSNEVPRIQESHITIGHIICDVVEQKLFWLEDLKNERENKQ